MHEPRVSAAVEERSAHSPTGPSTSESRKADIRTRLGCLSLTFTDNVVAGTTDFTQHVADEGGLAGMSERDKARARLRAVAAGLEGFVLGLDAPSYRASLSSLDDRALRKVMYEAFSTRASDRGPRAGRFDNTPVLSEILELRYELARLSGLKNYAELALADGVIPDPDRAERYLLARHRQTRVRAQAELDGLWAFAKARGVPRGFSPWDLPYYSAQLEREELELFEELSSYFAFDDVLAIVLLLGAQVSGVTLTPETGETEASGRYRRCRASDADGSRRLGTIVLDAYGPEDGLGEARLRVLEQGVDEAPCILVECAFEQPETGAPHLLGSEELTTLFRSVGSALYLLVARDGQHAGRPLELSHGAGICADVAGRFFAQFIGDFGTLSTLARHHETGQRLPQALFEKLDRRRTFLANLRASQALDLTLFDLRVHRDHVPSDKATQLRVQVLDTFGQVRREQSVLPPSYWTRFANTATPIFVHGRAARLWELDWAEEVGAALYSDLRANGFSRAATGRLRETLWAPGTRDTLERLGSALGRAPRTGR
jgi:oligopeptidase A